MIARCLRQLHNASKTFIKRMKQSSYTPLCRGININVYCTIGYK